MFLFVGRAKEPIKRIHLVHDSLLKIERWYKKHCRFVVQKILVLGNI